MLRSYQDKKEGVVTNYTSFFFMAATAWQRQIYFILTLIYDRQLV
jgi:hypothetical protein